MSWIEVGRFENTSDDYLVEKTRWEEVAYDVGLIPDKVVKITEDNGSVVVEVHEVLYGYFKQGLF